MKNAPKKNVGKRHEVEMTYHLSNEINTNKTRHMPTFSTLVLEKVKNIVLFWCW